jgi:hypothetical protein
MQARAAGYALTNLTTPKQKLVSWTVVGLTAAEFKLREFRTEGIVI